MSSAYPTDEMTRAVRAMCESMGIAAASHALGLAQSTTVRVAAGLRCHPGTILLVQQALAALAAARRAA